MVPRRLARKGKCTLWCGPDTRVGCLVVAGLLVADRADINDGLGAGAGGLVVDRTVDRHRLAVAADAGAADRADVDLGGGAGVGLVGDASRDVDRLRVAAADDHALLGDG